MELVGEPNEQGSGMSEKTPVQRSSDTMKPPAVGGDLLNALDTALGAAWEDDRLVEACAHDEELVGAFADIEFAVEVLRSALARLSPPCRPASGRDRERKRK